MNKIARGVLTLLISGNLFSQVGIGTNDVLPTEVLKVSADNKGVLLPNIFLNNLSFKPDGQDNLADYLLVYNTNPAIGKGFYFWKDNKWNALVNKTNEYRNSKILRLETAENTGGIMDEKAVGNVPFLLNESISAKEWNFIPGLEKTINIINPDNNIILSLDGIAQLYNGKVSANNRTSYSVGIFIDEELYAVREYTVNSQEQCGVNNFTLNTTIQNLNPGEHNIKVMALLNEKSSNNNEIDNLSVILGKEIPQCSNFISNDMAKISLSVKISE